MSEKRAKDRVILKMADLHGDAYSEEEADDFRRGAESTQDRNDPPARQNPPARQKAKAEVPPAEDAIESDSASDDANDADVVARLKTAIDKAKNINTVTDLMLHEQTQKALSGMDKPLADEIRDYAKARLVALGWPGKKAS